MLWQQDSTFGLAAQDVPVESMLRQSQACFSARDGRLNAISWIMAPSLH